MSSGQMPSGSNFWESNRGKGLIIGGTALCGGNQALRNMQETRHEKWVRSLKRIKGLKEGWINPSQYVLEASQDDLPSRQIKNGLVAWGETWKGTDFSNPEAFDVTDEWDISYNPARKLMGLKDRSSYLKAHPVDKETEPQSELFSSDARLGSVPPTRQKGKEVLKIKKKGTSTEDPGTRSVRIEGMEEQKATIGDINMEVQQVTEKGTDVSTGLYKFNPNLIYEVSAEQVETVQEVAVPDRHFTKVYKFTTSPPLPSIVYYGLSLAFVGGSGLLFNYLQHKLSKWTNLQDSQRSASRLEENRSVEALERVLGQKQVLDTQEGSATEATPEYLLEIFTCYKRGIISKRGAAYILVRYYNLSEVEALEVLDES